MFGVAPGAPPAEAGDREDREDQEQGEPPEGQTHHDHPPTTSRAAPADASKLGRSASAAPNCRG